MLIQNFIGKINDKSTKLLSLDIFDTLVFRLVDHPHQIFYEIGKKAIKSNLLHRSINAEEFALLRIKAEQDARQFQLEKKGHNEITLRQIYKFLPKFTGDRDSIQSLEVTTECEYCYLNPEILKLIEDSKTQGLPTVLTSDMYLSKKQLEEILRSNLFDLNLIKEIYVSCEHRGDKSSGILFRKLQSDFPHILPEKILHIGDKFEADFDSPRSLGINAILYDVIPEKLKEVFEYEKIYQSFTESLSSLRKLAIESCIRADSIETQIGTAVLGPALTLFCDWVLDICANEGKENIYPLMREAELLEPLLKNAAKNRQMDLDINPLFVSRESTWLASLTEWNLEECENICNRHRISVKEILNSLSLDLDTSFKDIHDYEFKSLNSEQQKGFVEFLISQPIKKKIELKISERCKLLESYLINEISDSRNIVTVDLGFNGSINKNLENIISKSSLPYSATHLLAFGSDEIIKLKSENIDIRSFYTSPGINQDLLKPIQRSSFPLEQLFFTGKVGSVTGYKNTFGKTIPITEDTNPTEKDISIKKNVRSSIQNFQSHWYKLYEKKKWILRQLIESESKRRIICSTITRLLDMPLQEEAEFLGNLKHDYNNGSNSSRLVFSRKDSQLLSEIGCEEKFLNTSRLRGVHWPQGVITKQNRYFLFKKKLDESSSESYLQTMNNLMGIVKGENYPRIIIYGAGEVGKSARKAAEINQIEVNCFVDRKESLWGTQLEEITICSLEKALDGFLETPFVIGSFEFLEQIEGNIAETLAKRHLNNRVFSVKDLE